MGYYRGGPVICIICEYDALPVVGHACGHNLIAEAGFAAGVAVKEALRADPKLKGKIVVLGTPAEESGGGKIDLINAGAFADIDVAMMVHPSRSNELVPLFIGVGHISVTYHGKAAHSSGAPWDGINAVDAAVMCYNGLSYLRQHIKPNCRVGAIFTDGGAAVNIIPERSAMDILYRAPTVSMMAELRKKVMSCISAGAEATGCTMEVTRSFSFKPVVTNSVLARLYKKHAETLGCLKAKHSLSMIGSYRAEVICLMCLLKNWCLCTKITALLRISQNTPLHLSLSLETPVLNLMMATVRPTFLWLHLTWAMCATQCPAFTLFTELIQLDQTTQRSSQMLQAIHLLSHQH
ncbi:xaa-Arg dipeptidase-like isoform X2 [Dermacentor albipictus]|uniref:xaa-Arg dipeptidase-like isoform X2 n=1 Tax=Dermacentor albipictus TaxID=60249 RepID=UPI0031FCC144